NQRRQRNEPTRGTMRARIVLGVANIVAIAGWYAVIIPATYGATHFLRCHLSFGNQPGGCQEHPFVFASIAIGGAVLGMIIALSSRRRRTDVPGDRKSTRLNSSHVENSYAVFCLKKKNKNY